MMTLDEMKLAVCEKLPELIDAVSYWPHAMWTGNGGYLRQTIRWPTEGLQVCHEAWRTLSPTDKGQYITEQYRICLRDGGALGEIYNATLEQRLEALCRVWFPEKF